MIRAFLIIFLIVMTTWGVSPHQSCFCAEKPLGLPGSSGQSTPGQAENQLAAGCSQSEHSCCHFHINHAGAPEGPYASRVIGTVTPCCCTWAMAGKPILSTSISIGKLELQPVCQTSFKQTVIAALLPEVTAASNRPPPPLLTPGGTKTYLRKRVLLI